jgi:rare lipoprotein A
MGKTYYTLKTAEGYRNRGTASWYGRKFHGNKTANGERYDMYAMTAAHKTLPIPSYAKVRNLKNGREAIVRINDRGPFIDSREIDLSYAAAVKLGVYSNGTAPVEVTGIEVSRNGRWHSLPDTVPAPQRAQASSDLAAMRSQSSATTNSRGAAVNTAPQFQARPIEPAAPATAPSYRSAYPTAAPNTAPQATTPSKPLWWVQTGAFGSHSGAETLSNRLQLQGFPNRIVNTRSSALAYKVRVGPFEIETHARWAQASLGDKGLNKGFVIQAPAP